MFYIGTRVNHEGNLGRVAAVEMKDLRVLVTVALDNGSTVKTSGKNLTEVFFDKTKS